MLVIADAVERAGDELNANCHPTHGTIHAILTEEVSHWILKLVSKAQKP